MKTITLNEHTFILELLSQKPIIVDLGCCCGGFLSKVKESINYEKIIGIEANPINYETVKGYSDTNIVILNKAVCSEKRSEKEITFTVDLNDTHVGSFVFDEKSAALCRSTKTLQKFTVPTIKISEIFSEYQLDYIDLLKIDIEGAEWEILNDLNDAYFEKIKQISVEFHDFIDPSMKPKTQEVISKLKSLGYEMIHSGAPWFYGTKHFDCLFYKKC